MRGERVRKFEGGVLLKIPDAKGQLQVASLSDRTISNYFRRFMCQNDAIKSGDGPIICLLVEGGDGLTLFSCNIV